MTAPRRKFLVVVDNTPECKLALRYAALRAARTGGGVALLYVIEPMDRQAWGAVEQLMRTEAREEALRILTELSQGLKREHDLDAEVIVREGKRTDALMRFLDEDRTIKVLVLGASPAKDGPGPLVTFLAGQAGLQHVALTLIPGGLTALEVEALA